MPHLLLLVGTNVDELIDNIPEIKNAWFDPFEGNKRAVLELQKKPDLQNLQGLLDPIADPQPYTIYVEQPAKSVLVMTYGTIKNKIKKQSCCHALLYNYVRSSAEDKLKKLFKTTDHQRTHVKHIHDDYFVVDFEGNWDFVQEICQQKWIIKGQELLVTPYFESFNTPVDHQLKQAEFSDKRKNLNIKISLDSIFLWILDVLKFKKQVHCKINNLKIEIDSEKGVVYLEGPFSDVKRLETCFSDIKGKVSFTEDEKIFLTYKEVQEGWELLVNRFKLSLQLDDNNSKLVITNNYGDTKSFEWFLSCLKVKQECLPLPTNFYTSEECHNLTDLVKKHHTDCHVVTISEKVFLLKITDSKRKSVVQLINETIKTWTDSLLSSSSNKDSFDVEEYNYSNLISCDSLTLQYCKRFLREKISNVEKQHRKNCKTRVDFIKEGLKVECNSEEMGKEFFEELKVLMPKIKSVKKTISIPQTSVFLETDNIDSLSEKYKCLIDLSKNTESSSSEENESSDSIELQYKVAMLGTAKFTGFNVHFIEGDIEDMNLKFKVEFHAKQKVDKCELRLSGSSFKILLPSWQAPEKTNYHTYFQSLRTCLQDCVSQVLSEAQDQHCQKIAFSTAQFHCMEYPFPIDVIAKTVIDKLCEKYNEKDCANITKPFNVYICEPNNEAVFKAFRFYMQLKHVHIGPPDQRSWNKICFHEIGNSEVPDYNAVLKTGVSSVKVASKNPSQSDGKTVFFYPIQPSLEIQTCPAIHECIGEKELLFTINYFLKNNPDGLLIGDTCILKGFSDKRHAFAYCSPEWDLGSGKAIHHSLTKCMQLSQSFEAIQLIPPGLNVRPPYPMRFLVQRFFRELDDLFNNNEHLRQKQITIIVCNESYGKAFEEELIKRYESSADRKKVGSDDKCKGKTSVKEITVCGTSQTNIKDVMKEIEKMLKIKCSQPKQTIV